MRKNLECTPSEHAAWEEQASVEGYKSVAQWMRDTLNRACETPPGETLPAWGMHNSPRHEMTCGWCGSVQMVSGAEDECRACGECEFID